MARKAALLTYTISTLLIALNAGFFYTWSFTIMQSLGQIDAQHAIGAMQAINANIRTAWFAVIFFGAPAALLFTAVIIFSVNRTAAAYALLAFLFAAITVILTLLLHVPMNNQLATVEGATATQSVWTAYSERWTGWNHARTLMSVFALALSLIGLTRLQTRY